MAECTELMDSKRQRLQEVASAVAEEGNLVEKMQEMVLPSVLSIAESVNPDSSHPTQILLGKNNTAMYGCQFNITNHYGGDNGTLQKSSVAEVDAPCPLPSKPVQEPDESQAAAKESSSLPSPKWTKSNQEMILRVVPLATEMEGDFDDDLILVVWICWDDDITFQKIVTSEHDSGNVTLDSYDTIIVRKPVGKSWGASTISIHVSTNGDYSWEPREYAKRIQCSQVWNAQRAKCSFRIQKNPDYPDSQLMYINLLIQQNDDPTDTQFILRKRISDIRMPQEQKGELLQLLDPKMLEPSTAHSHSVLDGNGDDCRQGFRGNLTEKSSFTCWAIPYVDKLFNCDDDVIVTLWLCWFDERGKLLEALKGEQKLYSRKVLDTENSFVLANSEEHIRTEMIHNGYFDGLNLDGQKVIAAQRIVKGMRAKFQFISKRMENSREYADRMVHQIGKTKPAKMEKRLLSGNSRKTYEAKNLLPKVNADRLDIEIITRQGDQEPIEFRKVTEMSRFFHGGMKKSTKRRMSLGLMSCIKKAFKDIKTRQRPRPFTPTCVGHWKNQDSIMGAPGELYFNRQRDFRNMEFQAEGADNSDDSGEFYAQSAYQSDDWKGLGYKKYLRKKRYHVVSGKKHVKHAEPQMSAFNRGDWQVPIVEEHSLSNQLSGAHISDLYYRQRFQRGYGNKPSSKYISDPQQQVLRLHIFASQDSDCENALTIHVVMGTLNSSNSHNGFPWVLESVRQHWSMRVIWCQLWHQQRGRSINTSIASIAQSAVTANFFDVVAKKSSKYISDPQQQVLRLHIFASQDSDCENALTIHVVMGTLNSSNSHNLTQNEVHDWAAVDSYDTFLLTSQVGGCYNPLLKVTFEAQQSSHWLPESDKMVVDVKELLKEGRMICSCRFLAISDSQSDFFYGTMRISQTVGKSKEEVHFVIKKKVEDIQSLRKEAGSSTFENILPIQKPDDANEGVMLDEYQTCLAVSYVDLMRNITDDIILTVWICSIQQSKIDFNILCKEQKKFMKIQLDTENSFIFCNMTSPVSAKVECHGLWTVEEPLKNIDPRRIREGGRAKFQFLCKRGIKENSNKFDVEITIRQNRWNQVQFMTRKKIELFLQRDLPETIQDTETEIN